MLRPARVVVARGVSDAARIIASRKLSAAILDFRLGVGVDCLPICGLLTERGVPFLLYTAYTLLEPNANSIATSLNQIEGIANLLAVILSATCQ
jgi:hypothetical protein